MQNLIEKNKKQLEKIFEEEGAVLAYLFGSATRRKMGPLSDVDIAVLFSGKVKKDDYFAKRLKLASKIDEALGIYKTEVICLNDAPPLLKHRVVFYGIVIFVSDLHLKRNLELQALQEYEDFKYHLETGYKIMGKQIKEGAFGKAPLSPKEEKIF